MKSKYLNKIYDGMRKIINFDRKSTMYTLENIYNGSKILLSYKALVKVDRNLTTISRVTHNNIKRHHDTRLKNQCCICGRLFKNYGNNPYPVKEEGLCCDECNFNYVIPARLKSIYKS